MINIKRKAFRTNGIICAEDIVNQMLGWSNEDIIAFVKLIELKQGS